MNFDKIYAGMSESIYELDTDSRLAQVGLKDKQESEKIIKKYEWLYSLETINLVRKNLDEAVNLESIKKLRLLYYDLSESYLFRKLARESDEISNYFSNAKTKIDKEDISFYDLRPAILKSSNFEKREIFNEAEQEIIAHINDRELLSLEKEIAIIRKDMCLPDYKNFYENKKKIDYSFFDNLTNSLYLKVKEIYDKLIPEWTEEKLNKKYGNLKSCHMAYALQLSEYSEYFPAGKLVSSFKNTLNNLGLDLELQKNIHLDLEDRPRKTPRAFCSTPKIPDEIHLVIKANGGIYDYEAFFHEGGHAEHFANVYENIPFEYRQLQPSYALTELYSYLFEDLIRNPDWLRKNLGLSEVVAKNISRDMHIAYLYMLMRYLAKFKYEYRLFSGEDLASAPVLYSETLDKFTGFKYDSRSCFYDLDSGFYSADYLRAWIGQAQMNDFLTKHYGDSWFEKKEAGDFLKQLWGPGSKYDLEEVIEKNGIGDKFDCTSLVEKFKKNLH